MKVLVTGGRDYPGRARVFAELDAIHEEHRVTCLIVGDCPTGVDKFARDWAHARGVVPLVGEAPWDARKRAAGPIRNGVMVGVIRWEPGDCCVAFPGGSGTADCTGKAKAAGLEVREIR